MNNKFSFSKSDFYGRPIFIHAADFLYFFAQTQAVHTQYPVAISHASLRACFGLSLILSTVVL
jgi:hypothetical protein